MKLDIKANITLILREQDVNLLLKALQHYRAATDEEKRNRAYLLDILGYLATPAT